MSKDLSTRDTLSTFLKINLHSPYVALPSCWTSSMIMIKTVTTVDVVGAMHRAPARGGPALLHFVVKYFC